MMAWASEKEANQRTEQANELGLRRLITRHREGESDLRTWMQDRLQEIRDHDRDRLVLWLPVGFAFGAGATCSVRADDPAFVWVILTFLALGLWLSCSLMAQRSSDQRLAKAIYTLGLLGLFAAASLGGGASGLLRAEAAKAPRVSDVKTPYLVTGYVEQIDRTQRGTWRAKIVVETLSHTRLEARPKSVRVALAQDEPPKPGQKVRCQAILRPPPGPVVPGAYDHARRAWFQGLGGVGYALRPCAVIEASPPLTQSIQFRLALWRAQAARSIVEATDSDGGGFLAAVTTGDRAWLSEADVEALQASGLSHVISVSGLHVGLLGGLIYLVIWKLAALVPALSLRLDARKIAAVIALCGTGAYCIFTGAEAPAVRAFIMSGIAFGAILLNRKAISMRGLAIAAICVLVALPESAIDPGFQMSFLATAALVALWEIWERRRAGAPELGLFQRAAMWLGGAAATSVVAGLATAPISAATFGRVSVWSLPANLMAAPILDFWVAPFSAIAASLAPFGLDDWAWQAAASGLSVTLKIAHWIAALPGANASIAWTSSTAPLILIVAILWLTLWRSWLRLLAIVAITAGVAIWAFSPKPVAWIGPEGRAILATPHGAAPSLCRTSGGRFDATRLLDKAGLSQGDVARLLPEGEHRLARGCTLGEGDWEGRYVYAGRGRGILTIGFDGQSHVFGRGDIPTGALLMRNGWRLYFYPAAPRRGPWAKDAADPEAAVQASEPLLLDHEE
ncbi:ComEC/Rec2 family competence protein [Aquidulcibacter sp.]|uniref:ComEC/Rec2 family competence protein n=1 Tax=Aquidulcibacter sp. TaxID=2052990 RepID=UPI0025C3F870|nr:ComEC/Rec2 family competence protein [Aquidulcibacter sp.]MCA3695225.1 ComEC/Rec2 family competence protein [Aquidulcibacter sp.]